MDEWQRRVLLEGIVYKMFRGMALDVREKGMVDDIVEMRDYGRRLD